MRANGASKDCTVLQKLTAQDEVLSIEFLSMNNITAKTLIDQLALARHPEGGWFKETYRASDKLAAPALPVRFGSDRSASTAIYFLLEAGDI